MLKILTNHVLLITDGAACTKMRVSSTNTNSRLDNIEIHILHCFENYANEVESAASLLNTLNLS